MRLVHRPRIAPGESLTSHVRRTLDAGGLTRGNLPQWTSARVNWQGISVFAERRMMGAWAHLTDHDYGRVRAATFHQYATALPLLTPALLRTQTVAMVARRTWLWPGTTQACRRCLGAEPSVWALAWRLPYTFACERHGSILLTHCPGCGETMREHHRCRDRSFGDWVTGDPDTGDMRPASAAQLATARRISSALNGTPVIGAHNARIPPADYLDAIRTLAGLNEHLQRLHEQCADAPRRAIVAAPRDPQIRAALLTDADALIQMDPRSAADTLQTRLDTVLYPGGIRAWVRDHSHANPVVSPILEVAVERKRTVGRRRTTALDLSPTQIPQLIWPWAWRDLAELSTAGSLTGRCFASMVLMKAIHGGTWQEAGARLGLPPNLARHVARTGKRGLDKAHQARYFQILEHITLPDERADHRHREAHARGLIAADPDLRTLRHALQARHLRPHLLREKLWTVWVLAHPALTPLNADAPAQERRLVSTQRARWSPQQDQITEDWAQASYETQGQ